MAAPGARPSAGKTQGKGDPRAQVESYLGSHDVAMAADLHAIAASPEKPLMAIARDPKAERLVRARAVAALRIVPTPAVRNFLGRLLEDNARTSDPTDRLLVRRAAIALGWLGGPDAGKDLALLFENADTEVRVDAAIGISLTRAENAVDLLRRQLAVEQAPRVRQQIERQLRALGQVPPQPAAPRRPKEQTPMRGGL